MVAQLSKWLLKVMGWKVTGRYPYEVPKLIICVAPHTSNWDFPVGVLVRSAYGIKANFVAKHSLFKPPLGALFRWMGGIPVDRTKSGGSFVNSIVEAYKNEPHMHLVITPEGTRKKVGKLKTGIHRIALQANVPIVLTTFLWKERTVHFDEKLYYVSEDQEKDMAFLWDYYEGIEGCVPENSIYSES